MQAQRPCLVQHHCSDRSYALLKVSALHPTGEVAFLDHTGGSVQSAVYAARGGVPQGGELLGLVSLLLRHALVSTNRSSKASRDVLGQRPGEYLFHQESAGVLVALSLTQKLHGRALSEVPSPGVVLSSARRPANLHSDFLALASHLLETLPQL